MPGSQDGDAVPVEDGGEAPPAEEEKKDIEEGGEDKPEGANDDENTSLKQESEKEDPNH